MIIHQLVLVCSLKKSTGAFQISQCKTAHSGPQDYVVLPCTLYSSLSCSPPCPLHLRYVSLLALPGAHHTPHRWGPGFAVASAGTLFVLHPRGLLPYFLLGLLSPYSSGYYLLSTRPKRYLHEGRQTVCLVLERVPDTPENSVFVG